MEQHDFDWGELGRVWWLETAQSVGATERHAVFAAVKHRGGTNTDAARSAGFGGGSEASVRSEGYRLARSNKIMRLLALAAVEAGGGYDGNVTLAETKQILSTLARGSDPAVRIKALEALNKLDEQERRRNERIEVADYAEELYQLARALPQSGLGALLGLSHYFQTTGHIINFPYLTEVAPIAAQRFSDDWQRWRSKHSTDEIAVLDKLAAGPLLDGDSLVSAIKAKQPRHVAVPKIEEALLEKSRENGVA
jgi:hypothetical protein